MKTKTYTDIKKVHADYRMAKHILVQIYTPEIARDAIAKIIESVKNELPQAVILGMTVDVSIKKGRLLEEETLYIVTRFEKSRVKSMLYAQSNFDRSMMEQRFLEFKNSQVLPPKALIVLSNPFGCDSELLMQTISDVLPRLTLAGGLASDHRTFTKTYVFTDAGVSSEGFAAVMLYGESLEVKAHYDMNWRGLGKKFTVTSAQGNRLYTLDKEPAIDIYRRYLGQEVYRKLPRIGLEFPLLLKDGKVPVARAVMQVHDDGSLTFAGAIPEGTTVQFGFADIENLLDDPNRHHGILSSSSVESIFVFSCIARYTLVGKEIEAETLQMQHIATTAGAFTYGEFYHDASIGRNRMLNQSMTALALSEGGTPRLEQKIQRRIDSTEATYGRALSHFLHEVTGELESALEAERHSKEMLVRQSRQASMGEIIEMIAHQWRQPLNIVALTLQEIYIKGQLDALEPDTLEALYDKANGTIQYLSETIDDFRNFLKPDIAPERFRLDKFFKELEPLVEGLLTRQGARLEVTIADKCELYSRKNELKQVIVSLMNNAAEAMADSKNKDRRITIICENGSNKVTVKVCDSGPGIPEDVIDRIFDPYFTTKAKQNGTGLGLYIASQIVQKSLEGTIEAFNTDDGACFLLSLPYSVAGKL